MSQANQVNASLDDDNETDALGGDDEKGLSAKKLLLFIVLPLLIIGGGVGAYFMGFFDTGTAQTAEHKAQSDHKKKGENGSVNPMASFLKIPDMIVNLSSDDGQPRYLRLSVQLELKNEEEKIAVEKVMPRVIDQFQTYLRELRVKDLRGSAGIYRLQMELLSRVNAAAYPVEVQDVLFQEILIQ